MDIVILIKNFAIEKITKLIWAFLTNKLNSGNWKLSLPIMPNNKAICPTVSPNFCLIALSTHQSNIASICILKPTLFFSYRIFPFKLISNFSAQLIKNNLIRSNSPLSRSLSRWWLALASNHFSPRLWLNKLFWSFLIDSESVRFNFKLFSPIFLDRLFFAFFTIFFSFSIFVY
jgi:hypothetical protein